MRIFRRFFRSLSNLFKWFSIIWNDRDYDQGYLYRMLIFKLSNMRDFFLTSNIAENDKKHGNEIAEVVALLEACYNDTYEEELREEYYKKWGEPEMLVKLDGAFSLRHKNAVTPEQVEQAKKELFEFTELAYHKKTESLKKAFELMAYGIEGWWN